METNFSIVSFIFEVNIVV